MVKTKIHTTASSEPVRLAADSDDTNIARGPTDQGNHFDVRMQNEPDGQVAAKKIVDILKEKGVAVVQANAPRELVHAANEEAAELWEEGSFGPPLRVHDDRSHLEAQLWKKTLASEDKVLWIKQKEENKVNPMQNALRLLSNNLADFGGGLQQLLQSELGIDFDRHGHAMLSCYTGDRSYPLHLDNSHANEDEEDVDAPVDNGMRLTLCYFINMYWNPNEGYNGGGLDVYLTDPKEAPASASNAKSSPKLRVAPHADTLVLFLSERMAHQVIETKGNRKWFCMTVWCLNSPQMTKMSKQLVKISNAKNKEDSDED